MAERRTIEVGALARVEGEGALHLTLEGDRVTDLRLEIYEPPRFFESFLRGRSARELPDLVARICGICPVAYQMSALHAVESIFEVEVHPAVRALRRLYYCGEWIESHLLHMVFLAAPDYLGVDDGIAVARLHPAEVERALRLRALGNRIVALLGGRPVNPVGACIGGFTRMPTRAELRALASDLASALGEAEALLAWIASLEIPRRPQSFEWVSLRHPTEYPLNEGRLVSSRGLDVEVARFDDAFVESQLPHSTALHCRLRHGGAYLVGPLARVLLNADRLHPASRAAFARAAPRLQGAGLDIPGPPPHADPSASVLARGIEVVYAIEEALRLCREVVPPLAPRASTTPGEAATAFAPRAGVGHAATEAPRGVLYIRVETDAGGDVREIRIVPPTSQNQARIEEDLRGLAPGLLPLSHDAARRACETTIRSYDPCISCSTHFLTLEIERRPPRAGDRDEDAGCARG